MEQAQNIKNKVYDFNPGDLAPEELQRLMWNVLEWRDAVYREILKKIEMVPGLSELVDELTDALNACEPPRGVLTSAPLNDTLLNPVVFTVLEPLLKVRAIGCCAGPVNSSAPSQYFKKQQVFYKRGVKLS